MDRNRRFLQPGRAGPTPAHVQGGILERLNTIGKKGGLILAPTHHVHLDASLENFWAMQRAITEITYPSLKT